jgi:hypothetical protein
METPMLCGMARLVLAFASPGDGTLNRLFRWPRLAMDDTTRAAVMMALAGAAINLAVRRASPQRSRNSALVHAPWP